MVEHRRPISLPRPPSPLLPRVDHVLHSLQLAPSSSEWWRGSPSPILSSTHSDLARVVCGCRYSTNIFAHWIRICINESSGTVWGLSSDISFLPALWSVFPSLTDSFVFSLLPLGPAAVNSPFRSPLPSHIQLSIGAGLPLPLPHSGFAEAKVLFFYSPSPLFSPLRNETQFRPLSFLPPFLPRSLYLPPPSATAIASSI